MNAAGGTPVETLSKDDIPQLRNIPVYAGDEEIGHVGDVYYDEDRGRVECVGVKADAIGFSRRWIPARGATLQEDGLYLPYGREQLEGAPDWEDEDLDEERYEEVRGHYATGEPETVRHEEELQVGKREAETGRVRLKKWVETEPVEEEVELRRETARVTREPVDERVGEGAIGDEEVEVELRAEEPVVEKETVAKERVGLEKDVETETERVEGEVRKERVEVEGDAER